MVYGDLIIIYPNSYSIYLRGTLEVGSGFRVEGLGFIRILKDPQVGSVYVLSVVFGLYTGYLRISQLRSSRAGLGATD